jgi:diguanylate cyclase (GGDEF)-like protein/PAS domain S-box-containing protein
MDSKGRDYRAMVETMPAIVYIAEPGENGRWHYVNDWIEPILGFTVEEWTADPRLWARQLHPDDRAKALAAESEGVTELSDIRALRHDFSSAYYLDYRMLHRDGHVVWIRDNSRLLRGEDGSSLWHGVLLDISDQKQTEHQLERQSAAQAAVARLGAHALAGLPIQDLLDEACRVATEVLEVEGALAHEIGEDRGSLRMRAGVGMPTPDSLRDDEVIEPDSPTGHMLATSKVLLVPDWQLESRFAPTQRVLQQGIRASLGVRIEGSVAPWGAFRVFSLRPDVFSEADVNFVVSVANILSEAIERQEAEDAMQHRALHDPLTALPNRVLFTDRLEQALERGRRHTGSVAAVLFIDLDHFKQVNDTLGHQAGDELLITVASRLREAVRPTDTVARFGGDEFGLLLDDIASERVAIATAERIAASFARPFMLEAGTQFVTASIGIALANGHQDAPALLHDADAAMYRAKQRGRARYDLFDEDLRVRAVARGRMENDLRRAIETNELRLAYQPVVRLRDETMYAVEALLRWEHPQRGLVAPGEFIPVAEESGLIDRIGEWVLRQVLRDAARWEQARPDLPPLRLGINTSSQQLRNPLFAEQVGVLVTASGIDPTCVNFELDETVLREEADQMRRALSELKRLGIGLAVHNFGHGDSSLMQLAAMRIDTIKVDRRFVAQLGDGSDTTRIAHAVIATGTALGLTVIGAGTETEEQVRELRRLGCVSAQGMLFSPPVPAVEIEAMLRDTASLRRTLV